MEETNMMATEDTDTKTNTEENKEAIKAMTTEVKTENMTESYTIADVDSLEFISNRIITLLTMHEVKKAKLTLKMTILTDDLEADKKEQINALGQSYIITGAECLPVVFDHIKTLYEKYSIPGIKSGKLTIALKLFVPEY